MGRAMTKPKWSREKERVYLAAMRWYDNWKIMPSVGEPGYQSTRSLDKACAAARGK